MREGDLLLPRLYSGKNSTKLVDVLLDEGLNAADGTWCQECCKGTAAEAMLVVRPGVLNVT